MRVLCKGNSINIIQKYRSLLNTKKPTTNQPTPQMKAKLGAACDFPQEGLCVFWLNDSLHISSPTLSPLGCTSAPFPLLAHGAFFLRVLFPPLPPLPPPQQDHPCASISGGDGTRKSTLVTSFQIILMCPGRPPVSRQEIGGH